LIWSLLADLAFVFHREGDTQRVDSTVALAVAMLDGRPDEPLALEREPLSRLILLLRYRGDWAKLDVAYRHLVEVEKVRSGPRSAVVASTYANWAEARLRQGTAHGNTLTEPRNGADSLVSIAAAIVRDLDRNSIETALATVHAAAAARNIGALAQSDSLYRMALAIYRARLGDDHHQVALVATNLAMTLLRRGMAEQAVPLLEDALATYRGGSEFAELVPVTEWRLASALQVAGMSDESIAAFRRSLAGFETTFPPDYILAVNARHEFAGLLIELDRAAEAEPLLRNAIPVLAARWGVHDVRVDDARITLASALTALGRYAEADETLAATLDRLRQNRGAADAITLRAREAQRALERVQSRPRS
jgi:tetratricopeptide (TPR) repeat protein